MVPIKSDHINKDSGISKRRSVEANSSNGNPQAEQLVIAGLIKFPNYFYDFCHILADGDFVIRDHVKIFEVISKFYKDVDSGTLLTLTKFESLANRLGFVDLNNNDLVSYIFDLDVSEKELVSYIYAVKRETIRRSYNDILMNLTSYIDSTTDSATDIISYIENQIISVSNNLNGQEENIVPLTVGTKDLINRLAINPGRIGLNIDFKTWQSMIGELRNGSLNMFISGTGVGKSKFGIYAAIYTSLNYGIPVLLADSEMTANDQKIRAFSLFSDIDPWIIETGFWKLSDDDLIKEGITEDSSSFNEIKQARHKIADEDLFDKFEKLPISYLSINGKSVDDVLPLARQWLIKNVNVNIESKITTGLLIYDYLKLSAVDQVSKHFQEYQLLGLATSALHDFVNKHNLCGIVFGQTNREIDDSINMIAASKRISELVDSLTLMREKTPEEKLINPDGNYLFKILKARHGQKTGRGYISVNFNGATGSFKEIGYSDGSHTDHSED